MDKQPINKVLLFVTTHPVQYYAPLFQQLAQALPLKVYYASDESIRGSFDKEFGTQIRWDLPLLEGYESHFLRNYSWKPSLFNGFFGLMNLGILGVLRKAPRSSLVVVHGWNYFYLLLGIVGAKVLGHRVAVRGDNPYMQEVRKGGKLRLVKKWLLGKGLFRFIDHFLYVGEENRKFYAYYGVPEAKLHFSPHAVDNARFQVAYKEWKPQKLQLRENLGIPVSDKVLLCVAKYIPKKNPMDLLEAFARLNRQDISLVMVGEGSLRPEMEVFIETKGMHKKVLLTGFVNQQDMGKYYALADVLVMASGMGETWGLAINEGMNFALPLLVSDLCGCHPDLVREGENGYVFPTGDVQCLSHLIDKLLIYPQKLDDMGQVSAHLITSYSYQKTVESLKALL
jgi:glycosyltransferase involved in cell wall biosynthesis